MAGFIFTFLLCFLFWAHQTSLFLSFSQKKRTPPKRGGGRGSAGSSRTGSRPGTPSIDSASTSNTLRAAASKLEQGVCSCTTTQMHIIKHDTWQMLYLCETFKCLPSTLKLEVPLLLFQLNLSFPQVRGRLRVLALTHQLPKGWRWSPAVRALFPLARLRLSPHQANPLLAQGTLKNIYLFILRLLWNTIYPNYHKNTKKSKPKKIMVWPGVLWAA